MWELPERSGHVDLRALMDRLGREQLDSVLLEGGAQLNWAALEAGIVQKVQAYVAPKLFGGTAPTRWGVWAWTCPTRASYSSTGPSPRLGEDLLLESEVDPDVHRNRLRRSAPFALSNGAPTRRC